MWPTPTVCGNYNRKGASKTSGDGLATQVRRRQAAFAKQSNVTMVVPEASGALNPTWVEWLMGFPLGWTDLGR
jgi:DNA (cytosine-5)-methyltransferase 1